MWIVRFFQSSIGKKMIMASTGMLLFLFLCTHVMGNSTIYLGSKYFQHYADTLHGFPVIVFLFGIGLLIIVTLHVVTGVNLYLKNREEGDSRYGVSKRVVENSLASRTMIYSGLFILVFLFVHVAGFTFRDGHEPISLLVKDLLGGFFYGSFYIVSFLILGLHLSHGFWSMLQTFGINHPRYNKLISILSLFFPVFFFLFFAGIPLYFMTGLGSSY